MVQCTSLNIQKQKQKKISFQVGLGSSHAVPCLRMFQNGTDLESVNSPDTKRWCRAEAFALLFKHFLRGQQTTMHGLFWLQLRVILQMNICNQFKMKVKPLSRVRLFVTRWTVAYQAPPSVGFPRQVYWSRLPFKELVNRGSLASVIK